MGWQTFGKLEVKNDGPFEYNPHYVRLSPSGYPHKWTSLENEGYFGIGVKKGEQYRFSVWTRIPDGKEAVNYQSYGWGFFPISRRNRSDTTSGFKLWPGLPVPE